MNENTEPSTPKKVNNTSYKSQDEFFFYKAINPNIEVTEQGYVWYNAGERDNSYPNRLLDLANNASSIHSNMINLKANLTFAGGLVPKDKNDINVQQWLRKTNKAGQSMNEIYRKMCMDFSIFEAAALQVIYNALGEIIDIYHVCPSYLRAQKPNNFGYVEKYLLSDSWGVIENKRNYSPRNQISKAEPFAVFNPANGVKDMKQILYIKKYSSGNDVYATVSYNSALTWVQLDYELSIFHLKKVTNSFTPTGIVAMTGNPDEQEKLDFAKNFKKNHTGSDNTGKLLFMWNDNVDQQPQFIRLEADPNNNLYEELNTICGQKIVTGHAGSMELAGITSGGASLGGDANLLSTQRAVFTENVISGFQTALLEGINKITKFSNIGEVTVINEPLKLKTPTEQPTDTEEDERRMLNFGLGPKESKTNIASSSVNATGGTVAAPVFNEALASMTGKQMIQMNRIIRQIASGKLNKAAGMALLKTSFGFDDALIASLLMDDEIEEVQSEISQEPKPVLA